MARHSARATARDSASEPDTAEVKTHRRNIMRKMTRIAAGLAVFLMAAGAFCQGIPEYLNVGSITIMGYDKDKLPADLVIPEGITGIRGGVFEGCEQLKSVTIPGSMEIIGEDTYWGELSGDDWFGYVSHFVFYKCQSLKDLKIEDGVKVIGAGAFADCWSLESVSIPASVTKICNRAFERCKNIRTVRFGGTMEQWKKLGTYRFENTAVQCKDGTVPAVTKNLLVPGYFIVKDTVITGVEKEQMWYDGGLLDVVAMTPPSELVIPDGITEIGDEAFTDRFVKDIIIISVTIPRSVEKVGTSAFTRLHSLESVMILGTAEIGARAFEFCKNLKSVAFESGVTKIGDSAFTGCKSLESVTVPASVKEIGRWAFSDCPNLSVQYDGTKEQWDAIKKSEYGIGKFSVRFKDGSVAETGDDTALKIGHKGPGGGIIFDVTDTLIYEMCELEGKVTWSDAQRMCEEYRGGGYDNWYLPSPEQMQKVYTNLVTTRKIPLNGWYWGFTWHYRHGDIPYAMQLNDGKKDDDFSDWGNNRKFSVIAVRAF